jgi:hypothetical protein
LDTSDRLEVLENFGVWCWRRIEKISWNNHVKNEEVLQSQGGKKHPTYFKMMRRKKM